MTRLLIDFAGWIAVDTTDVKFSRIREDYSLEERTLQEWLDDGQNPLDPSLSHKFILTSFAQAYNDAVEEEMVQLDFTLEEE